MVINVQQGEYEKQSFSEMTSLSSQTLGDLREPGNVVVCSPTEKFQVQKFLPIISRAEFGSFFYNKSEWSGVQNL